MRLLAVLLVLGAPGSPLGAQSRGPVPSAAASVHVQVMVAPVLVVEPVEPLSLRDVPPMGVDTVLTLRTRANAPHDLSVGLAAAPGACRVRAAGEAGPWVGLEGGREVAVARHRRPLGEHAVPLRLRITASETAPGACVVRLRVTARLHTGL